MFNLRPRVILNKNVHPSFKSILVQDFLKKREMLVDLLNPNYERWNAEFDQLGIKVEDDDPLKDFGGTEYCKFIRSKQEAFADIVNYNRISPVELRISETGHIYGVCNNIELKLVLAAN